MSQNQDPNKGAKVGSPHDTMFYKFITMPEVYRPFFRRFLPPALQDGLNWDSLIPLGERLVSDKLRNLYSDCLFSTGHTAFEVNVFFYVLLEHKHKPERLTPLQLLQYMVEIWQGFLRRNKKAKKLPYIHPMVFYTGKASYHKSLNFKDLIEGPTDLVDRLFNEPFQLATARDLGREGEAAMLNLMSLVFLKDMDHYYRDLLRILKTQPPQSLKALLEAVITYIMETDPDMNEEKLVTITQEELIGKESTMVMTLADRLRQSGKEQGIKLGEERGIKLGEERGIKLGEERGEERGKERGLLLGELKGKLQTLREMFGEGFLTREQYHDKAEPIQAKLDEILAEEDKPKPNKP